MAGMSSAMWSFMRIPVCLCIFYVLVMTPLMGRKNGYTVDANASYQVTKEISITGHLFPKTAVKQGYLYSIVYLPFYQLGSVLHSVFPVQTADWMRRKCLCWMNTVITGMTVGLLALVIRELGFRWLTQVGIAILYGFTTLAFTYSRYDYNKCLAGFLLLLSFYFFLCFIRLRMDRYSFATGLALGLLAMVRLELAGVALVYLLALIYLGGSMKERIKQSMIFLTPIIMGGLFVLIYNRIYWSGELSGGYEGGLRLTMEGFIGFLFSPGKNIWLFNPILLLLPLAVRPFFTKDRLRAAVWAGTVLFPFCLYALWWNWWGGWAYGPRHLVPLLPLMVIPLAVIIESGYKPLLWILGGLGMMGFFVQFLGGILDFNDVLLTMQKAGIPEQDWIWNPAFNAVLQHFQFMLAVPVGRWDYALIAGEQVMPELLFGLCVIIWILACFAVCRYGIFVGKEDLQGIE